MNDIQFGLSKPCVDEINRIFEQYDEIGEVIIYGSRAKGNFKSGSDIDLTLKGEGLNLSILNKITLALDDLMLPYTFDLSLYHQIKEADLIDHIQRVGKVFYSKDSIR